MSRHSGRLLLQSTGMSGHNPASDDWKGKWNDEGKHVNPNVKVPFLCPSIAHLVMCQVSLPYCVVTTIRVTIADGERLTNLVDLIIQQSSISFFSVKRNEKTELSGIITIYFQLIVSRHAQRKRYMYNEMYLTFTNLCHLFLMIWLTYFVYRPWEGKTVVYLLAVIPRQNDAQTFHGHFNVKNR